jgi:hypothetical protein
MAPQSGLLQDSMIGGDPYAALCPLAALAKTARR